MFFSSKQKVKLSSHQMMQNTEKDVQLWEVEGNICLYNSEYVQAALHFSKALKGRTLQKVFEVQSIWERLMQSGKEGKQWYFQQISSGRMQENAQNGLIVSIAEVAKNSEKQQLLTNTESNQFQCLQIYFEKYYTFSQQQKQLKSISPSTKNTITLHQNYSNSNIERNNKKQQNYKFQQIQENNIVKQDNFIFSQQSTKIKIQPPTTTQISQNSLEHEFSLFKEDFQELKQSINDNIESEDIYIGLIEENQMLKLKIQEYEKEIENRNLQNIVLDVQSVSNNSEEKMSYSNEINNFQYCYDYSPPTSPRNILPKIPQQINPKIFNLINEKNPQQLDLLIEEEKEELSWKIHQLMQQNQNLEENLMSKQSQIQTLETQICHLGIKLEQITFQFENESKIKQNKYNSTILFLQNQIDEEIKLRKELQLQIKQIMELEKQNSKQNKEHQSQFDSIYELQNTRLSQEVKEAHEIIYETQLQHQDDQHRIELLNHDLINMNEMFSEKSQRLNEQMEYTALLKNSICTKLIDVTEELKQLLHQNGLREENYEQITAIYQNFYYVMHGQIESLHNSHQKQVNIYNILMYWKNIWEGVERINESYSWL